MMGLAKHLVDEPLVQVDIENFDKKNGDIILRALCSQNHDFLLKHKSERYRGSPNVEAMGKAIGILAELSRKNSSHSNLCSKIALSIIKDADKSNHKQILADHDLIQISGSGKNSNSFVSYGKLVEMVNEGLLIEDEKHAVRFLKVLQNEDVRM